MNGVDGRGGGFPREFGFVENDVGGSGDAADIAEEDVKGIRSVGGAAEVYGRMATGGMSGFGDVGWVGCGNGGAAEREDGEEVGGFAVETREGSAAGLLDGGHAVVDVNCCSRGIDPVFDFSPAGEKQGAELGADDVVVSSSPTSKNSPVA